MPDSTLFSRFASVIKTHSIEELTQSDLLLLKTLGTIQSFYAPFEAINHDAKVVIVGICPGQQQWRNALIAAKDGLEQQLSEGNILKLAKNSGAFSGPIRKNLTQLLDHIGLHNQLGIQTSAELFSTHQDMVQMCSVLQQCILINGKNYAGSTPAMLKNELLKKHIDDYFIPMVQQLPNAIYIPLGKGVDEVLNYVSSLGYLNDQQILAGLPHPSGANAERIKYFLGEKPRDQLSRQTNSEQIDSAKSQILLKLSKLL
ncbi:hypothetical protein M5F00_12210 [Acinetobacter sp. ANC 4945]|uniref:Uracil-DNA glycosylase-like domain-containing protein n=1 Tax=Acinetobacter amyesii TaxID=2942470 RepID=A0A1T1GTJ2_9GAMM|nr:hypothetical protein [Acinetobacter amyesii]MCL6248623.1 hypothetical protein [Acinetobacter amyesii]OOV80908.1 hypothetical protein B1202_12955 [Acinetobacter amyesii]